MQSTTLSRAALWASIASAPLGALLVGCGGVRYAVAINAASARVEEAKALGADRLAPFEYYFAKEHLEQAQIEASEASYSDAIHLANEAAAHASAAIEFAAKARASAP
jgi:hypothetical protein